MKKEPHLKAAIAGRPQFTSNYESILQDLNISPIVTLSRGELEHCDLLILPGGGDITPAFFGQKNKEGFKNTFRLKHWICLFGNLFHDAVVV